MENQTFDNSNPQLFYLEETDSLYLIYPNEKIERYYSIDGSWGDVSLNWKRSDFQETIFLFLGYV